MTVKLYYAHDPMCAWCYAFRPVFEALITKLPDQVEVVHLLGGLAIDTDEPMPNEMREFIQANWHRIAKEVPGTTFNHDFWQHCQPRRSTYPACRAVIAAREQGAEFDLEMIWAIQQAYYLQARNPSDSSTLTELAAEIGLNQEKFSEDLQSKETDEVLRQEIKQSRQMGLNTFPSLLLALPDQQINIELDYLDANSMAKKINQHLI